jgi:hypothetical protein
MPDSRMPNEVASNVRGRSPSRGSIAALCLFVGCAAKSGEASSDLADDDAGDVNVDPLSAGGDWDIDDAAHTRMQSFSLPYDDAGDSCSGGFTDGAQKMADMLKQKFSGAIRSNEGYACRGNTANPGKLSIHAMERAVDVMVNDHGGAGGTEIANFLLLNGDLLGVQFIIWKSTKCNLSQKRCGAYGGPNPHTDHIHVEINEAAGSGNAPFYQGTALRGGGTVGGGSGGNGSGGASGNSSGGSGNSSGSSGEDGSSSGSSSGSSGSSSGESSSSSSSGESSSSSSSGESSSSSSSGSSGEVGGCTSDAECAADEWCSQHAMDNGERRCCTESDPSPECQD